MQEIATILREVIQKRQRRRERVIVTCKKQKGQVFFQGSILGKYVTEKKTKQFAFPPSRTTIINK